MCSCLQLLMLSHQTQLCLPSLHQLLVCPSQHWAPSLHADNQATPL